MCCQAKEGGDCLDSVRCWDRSRHYDFRGSRDGRLLYPYGKEVSGAQGKVSFGNGKVRREMKKITNNRASPEGERQKPGAYG